MLSYLNHSISVLRCGIESSFVVLLLFKFNDDEKQELYNPVRD